MIRYPIAPEELRRRIREKVPDWLGRAQTKTEAFRQAGKYAEKSEESIWGEIKEVFLEIQHEKCAYRERKLASRQYGLVEHDVEHYRPKNAVKKWPSKSIAKKRKLAYDFPTGEAFAAGYYLLAYQILNYTTSCATCNRPLKSNYFPISGSRGQPSDDPSTLQGEGPFLPHPVGEMDEDPEEILTFLGITAVPKSQDPQRKRRAQVTIDFFALNEREELRYQRAERILDLWIILEGLRQGNEETRQLAERALKTKLSSASAHTSCARAFVDLYRRDRSRAKELADAALEYLDGQS
ncbi:MAG TPA: hypothetical protein VHN15_12660 [Thermoanaerobaculia bacterium]|nr:hypothetical protein [Thermoanaerobaculia bacterium]